MTDEQKKILGANIGLIMNFYQIGKCGYEVYEGDFEDYFREHAPNLYEGNEDFIREVDRLIMQYYYAGRNSDERLC